MSIARHHAEWLSLLEISGPFLNMSVPILVDHGFHETAQGLRYTISQEARWEVLDRLLALNHERYAEEVAAGLHEKKKKAKRGKRKKATAKKKDDRQIKLL